MPTSFTQIGSLSKFFSQGDKAFTWGIYNDTSTALTIGMPLYADLGDNAENNVVNTSTALASGTLLGIQTIGRVVLGTNANAGRCVGVYQPGIPGTKPNNGDVLAGNILCYGHGVVWSTVVAGQTTAAVGGALITSTSVVGAVPGTAVVAKTIGMIHATSAVPAPSGTIQSNIATNSRLVNAFVSLA